ncbi:MAG: radical SAM protein, partial [Planctomycetaceae bacterium]|nr:radical SAM protein [Planctomycetaceae bacterium]
KPKISIGDSITLLRLLFDRRMTQTPRRVFRELERRGKSRGDSTRSQLTRGVWGRLKALRYVLRWLDGKRITRFENQWVINSFLPPFPGPAYDRLFENLLSERRWSPVSAFLAVTSECPADCWHCSLKKRRGGNHPTETWLRVIGELHQLGVSLFGVTGGEPLLRPDLAELVRAIKDGGGEVMMFTSGIGVTAERLRELKRAGLWAVCVSMDRDDADEAAGMRCFPGALETAHNALRLAKEAGIYTCVNCVADRRNVETQLYKSLYERAVTLGVDEFRLIEPMPCGQLHDADASTFLTPEQVAELRRFHRETNRQLSSKPHPTKVCAFNEIESPELFGCSGGTRHLFIDAAGEVCPCDFTPLSFGNVTEEPMAVIWGRMSAAMKHPRRHCIVQHHHELIRQYTKECIPAPVAESLKAAAALPDEGLPDFVQWAEAGNNIR